MVELERILDEEYYNPPTSEATEAVVAFVEENDRVYDQDIRFIKGLTKKMVQIINETSPVDFSFLERAIQFHREGIDKIESEDFDQDIAEERLARMHIHLYSHMAGLLHLKGRLKHRVDALNDAYDTVEEALRFSVEEDQEWSEMKITAGNIADTLYRETKDLTWVLAVHNHLTQAVKCRSRLGLAVPSFAYKLLGQATNNLYHQTGDKQWLSQGIGYWKSAIKTVTDPEQKNALKEQLANVYSMRATVTGAIQDIRNAEKLRRQFLRYHANDNQERGEVAPVYVTSRSLTRRTFPFRNPKEK